MASHTHPGVKLPSSPPLRVLSVRQESLIDQTFILILSIEGPDLFRGLFLRLLCAGLYSQVSVSGGSDQS